MHRPVLLTYVVQGCKCEECCRQMRAGWETTSASQVTTGTVDEGIYAMATRKTRLDAAVLDGITATGDGRKAGAAAETLQARAFVCLG